MYERLTKRFLGSNAPYTEFANYNEILNRLCEIEDKICEGKIVELPCAVGDKIFALSASYTKIYEFTIREFLYNGKYITVYGDSSWGENIAICTINEIGKGEVFIDRASAEAKLREMEGDNNEQR